MVEDGSMNIKIKVIIGCMLLTLLVSIILLFPIVKIDKTIINYNSNETYKISAYNIFNNLNNYIDIKDNLNKKKLGKYQVVVKVKYLIFRYNKTFTITIVDKEVPSISLTGNNPAYVCPNKEYDEEGYIATDNYDGDITSNVNITNSDNIIFYSVKDSSNNEEKVQREIIYKDIDKPVITLTGSESESIYQYSNYIESGYTAIDNCDGDITSNVIASGSVDTNVIGKYTINYKVSDSSGNEDSITREVIVKRRPVYGRDGAIYLTFDDGPSYLTKQILDILDEENIKATFFVTYGSEYVKLAYEKGHTIGLHTYSHDYSYVYSNEDNYFNDLSKVSNSVYNIIGIRSNIIRFPGGSSNTVSRNYSSGIMSKLVEDVESKGYIYFDWNVDSNDAGGDGGNSLNIYNNVINGLSHNKTNIVLMHDSASHIGTVNALRNIIKYGKDNGYEFKAITSDTPIVRHYVNN